MPLGQVKSTKDRGSTWSGPKAKEGAAKPADPNAKPEAK
eukprot:CAMPEP_0184692818 /NCGR_PEP_ID=MMETSP0313-20130426/1143_1 /TAXON_ID=2792 /ORGANISM="Porphyridium aerugineum, Strain SAG 1380-2" /LENGTH=38 /DNA_ID= /DNA_START= /DNA_END= /DNA_ORIENTATION=